MSKVNKSVKKPVKKKAKKQAIPRPVFSFRKNIMPPLVGFGVFFLTLLFINLQWIVAEINYDITEQHPAMASFQVDPNNTASTKTDPNIPPSVWIPAIDVRAPVIFGTSSDPTTIEDELRDGTVHYPSTANPGQKSNVAIFGHSAGLPWEQGNYKFVFTLLDKVQPNDQVIVTYKGIRYIYLVTGLKVVSPTDVSILEPTGTPTLTLITCSPVGTSQKRLVVTATQVSPSPYLDQKAPAAKPITASELPSNPPSFWQSIGQLF